MKFNTITAKLLVLITVAFVITTASVLYMANRQLVGLIDESQAAVYAEKMDSIIAILQRSDERLQKTGMVEAYLEDFQQTSLKHLRQTYYSKPNQRIYPFIIGDDGRVVMHPSLTHGDRSLIATSITQKMQAAKAGNFDFTHRGENKWYLYKKFPQWHWVIAYTVPLDIKYHDAMRFRYLLGYIMVGISLSVLLALALLISKFTRPIVKLTTITKAMADGDLDQQIKLGGFDEVGILARSFNHMRDAIRQQILELERENEARQKAQDALAAEKERLAVTLRSIGDGVITTDISGKVVFINNVSEVLTGWNNEEASGRDLAEIFHIINEQTREVCVNPATKVINSGQIVGLANHTVLIAKDGTARSIADSGAPIFDKDGTIVGVVLVFRDVTEQIRTEKELLKVKKLESVGVLAGGIAHDFNNILAAILGNINLALFDKGLKDETKNLLASAEKASLRAKDLTGQLLTFSKGGEPVKEMSSLENVIKDSASFVLHGDKVACHYSIPKNLWMVDIDKGQISQVIQNLVVNASQAMSAGGEIQITCENIHVSGDSQPFSKSGTFVKISIRDNGTGIPAAVLDKIFDPYFSTKKKGSGLGLAITHSIISKHGGHIAAESTPDNGSTFTIYLPASEKRIEQEQDILAVKKSSIAAKILVMDDEEILRSISESMLSHLGHKVVLSADGEEAVKLYQGAMFTEPFDLVIMDLTIPGGMGGKEAVCEILNLDPTAKVIVSSGYSNDPVMANFRDYGFSAAMVKPFQLSDMAKVINEIIA